MIELLLIWDGDGYQQCLQYDALFISSDVAKAICIFIVSSKIILILSTWDAVRHSKTAA